MASRKVVLYFPPRLIEEPVICRLAKQYDLEFNILRASITPRQEGRTVLELTGDDEKIKQGLHYVESLGMTVQAMETDVVQNRAKCTDCGACVAVCPTGALSMDRATYEVSFDKEKCISCELCVPACPPHAMEVRI
jgi:L-aspartate semialdehyde sulfurtransferase ferredoxin